MKNAFEFSILIIAIAVGSGYYFYYTCYQNKKLTSNEINTFNTQTQTNNLENKSVNNTMFTETTVSIPNVTQHGFHDHFAQKNGFNNNQLLGWRYWYLRNKSNYQVEPTDNFTNIPTRQYLNNMESLDNWFYDINTE